MKRQSGRKFWTYAPAVLLSLAALVLREVLPPWVYMWTVAAGLFFAAKWITVSKIVLSGARPPIGRVVAYVLLWPGLDAQAFCFGRATQTSTTQAMASAMVKIATGATMIGAAMALVSISAIAAGWLAMVGLVLILHFGIFELLAQFWQSRGIKARSLMQAPVRATSVSKLWSGRWNTAFTDLMHKEVFAPVAKRRGVAAAIITVFVMSGLIHELVISTPARGGYGLPTAYFCLQCAAVFVERSHFGARLGLGRGAIGWLFVMLIVAAPAVMLFPPVFVQNVILPMLEFFRSV